MASSADGAIKVADPPLPEQEGNDMTTPPPDVGLMPWVQVVGGFFVLYNTWGILVGFGTFQTYYETSGIIDANPSSIAWIGSIQAFLLLVSCPIAGRLFDAGYMRHLLVTGTSLIGFGLMMTSLVRSYYQAVLAQGICVGLGMGCLLVPGIGAASTWFSKRRGLALGLVTSGASVGGAIFPIMLQKLFVRLGFPWAVRTLGFMALATMAVSIATLKPRLPPRKKGPIIELRALLELEFALYASGMLAALLGFYVFYNFIEAFAISSQIDLLNLSPIYLLPIMNAASVFGRIIPNILSDHLGPLNVQVPSIIIASALIYAWLGVHSLGTLLATSILYGFSSGGLVGLPPSAVASMTPDMTRFGARMGVVFMFMGVGSLIGTPVTGALVQGSGDGQEFVGAKIWSASTMTVGAVLIGASRLWISHKRGRFIVKT